MPNEEYQQESINWTEEAVKCGGCFVVMIMNVPEIKIRLVRLSDGFPGEPCEFCENGKLNFYFQALGFE